MESPPQRASFPSVKVGPIDEHFRLLFELASDAIFVGLPDGTLTAVNTAACQLLGYSEQELLAMNARDLVAPEWLDIVDGHVRRGLEGLESEANYEMAFIDRSGTRIPIEMRSTILTIDDHVVGMHTVVRDIRDRRHAQAALHESEQRFQSAFEAPLVGMALAALDSRLLKVNIALCEMLGYAGQELLELRLRDLVQPSDHSEFDANNQSLLAGTTTTYQAQPQLRHSSGHYLPVRLSTSIFRDFSGQPAYTITQIIRAAHPTGDGTSQPCPLTERERQVLRHLAEGDSTAETADALTISRDTVHTYTRRATHKLGARTRTQAVVKAATNGWLTNQQSNPTDAGEKISIG